MRNAVVVLALSLGLMSTAALTSGSATASAAPTIVANVQGDIDVQNPGKDINVDINVNKGGGIRWYANPVWLAIGGVAVLLVIVLLAVAMRGGGGTTIVHD